jgi:uncharacterized membrane protein YdjX (TVP38/TMEM64 family)
MKIKKIKFVNFIMCLGLVAIIIFIIYGYRAGIFSSPERFRKFIEGFGVMEALIFLAIQIVQVIVPILPSSIGCVVGIMIFGPWMGFLYNYISICIGSTINFLLAKRYGSPFVKKVIGDKNFNKYIIQPVKHSLYPYIIYNQSIPRKRGLDYFKPSCHCFFIQYFTHRIMC